MAIYVTKKCPHCKTAYQIFQSGEQRKYGCPYKTCTKCFNHYWDNDIVEPALHGYKNAYEIKKSIMSVILIIMYTFTALLMLGGGIFFTGWESLIFLAFGGGNIWIIVSFIKVKGHRLS